MKVGAKQVQDGPVPIAYVIDQMGVGGTERQLAALISGLDQDRFEPHLFMRRDYDFWPDLECTKTVFPIRKKILSFQGAVQILRLAAAFRRKRIRIVQTFFADTTFIGVVAARLAGVPIIVTSRRDMGFWYTPFLVKNLRRIHRLSGHVLVNSQSIRDVVVEKEGIPRSDIHVIHNGLDPTLFENGSDRLEIRCGLGIRSSCPVVGTVANLNREVKRLDVFIDAVPQIIKRRPDVHFVIVGKGHLRKELEQRCKDLGVADNVTFTGGRDDVNRLLNVFDIGVNCSDSEGFSNAVLEYMMAGVPVVASDVGGNAELIDDGETGLLFTPGNPGELAARVSRLLDDAALVNSVREAARKHAVTRFAVDRMVRKHMDYYESLLGDAASGS